MATITLVASVFLSKAEALDVLSTALEAPWVIDDPSDVTLSLPSGGVLTIEVPKFGEDLPLTLDCHHDNAEVLAALTEDIARRLRSALGWDITVLP
jgi:hypothetical protein